MANQATGSESGTFGSISYEGNTINIVISDNSLGVIALTSGDGQIECFWDGNQWVCNSVTFGESS